MISEQWQALLARREAALEEKRKAEDKSREELKAIRADLLQELNLGAGMVEFIDDLTFQELIEYAFEQEVDPKRFVHLFVISAQRCRGFDSSAEIESIEKISDPDILRTIGINHILRIGRALSTSSINSAGGAFQKAADLLEDRTDEQGKLMFALNSKLAERAGQLCRYHKEDFWRHY